jgi:transposase-like protein
MFIKDLRKQLQLKIGLEPNKLVEPIKCSEIQIIETQKNAKLKQVTITHLPYEKYQIWRINLEKEIQGLSTANKTGEIALAILNKNYLNVYLIELKSAINNPTLKKIQPKFEDSMSRFYFLLSLNSDKDHENFNNLKIRFRALVFFNGHDNINTSVPDFENVFENIYKIFLNRGGYLSCETILDDNLRIPLKFFSEGFNKTTGSLEMSFSDIENDINKIRSKK